MGECYLTRRGGAAAFEGLPEFDYSGTFQLIDDGKAGSTQNWRIKFLTSGGFTPKKTMSIDVFVVGGGGGTSDANGTSSASGGAGSGYTKSVGKLVLVSGQAIQVTVGDGGSGNSKGGSSSFGGLLAVNGGNPGTYKNGGDGGSGGGCYYWGGAGKNGGNGGTNTAGDYGTGGKGQGYSTREFYELDQNASADLYSTGGAGENVNDTPTTPNSGNGANGVNSGSKKGCSGIVIIRNHREVAA